MTATAEPVLAIERLDVTFRGRGGAVPAVRDVGLTLGAGEIMGLVGGSGAGKSTVAKAVAGLVRPDRGSIRIRGNELVGAGRAEVRRIRRDLHLVFQDPYAALPANLLVADAIAEPLRIHRIGDRTQQADRVGEAATAVGLAARHLTRHPHELSGGERQRVALARALVTGPQLILADEPTAMLDASLRRDLVDLVVGLATNRGIAVLHITHDLALARYSCSRLAVMRHGRIVEAGPADEVITTPRDPYTAALIAAAT